VYKAMTAPTGNLMRAWPQTCTGTVHAMRQTGDILSR
jgi:hypothetical protein